MLFNTVFESISDAIIVTDKNAQIVLWNTGATKLSVTMRTK
ncbi:MAG: PAS domain S-box protein [Chitinophagaceae bacterium]|nr:PAS domain S-box protein [Oligoflexus sp.]